MTSRLIRTPIGRYIRTPIGWRVGSTSCGRRRGGVQTAGGGSWRCRRGRGESGREAEKEKRERERRRDRSDLYRTCSAGRGATPKRSVITRIGSSDWPRPLTRPTNFGRKPHHLVSGKVISDSENLPLRPHNITRIAHTKIGARIVPQKPRGRALATDRRSRMLARASATRR